MSDQAGGHAGSGALPAGMTMQLDARVRMLAGASVIVGGSPWKVSRLHGIVRDLVCELQRAGPSGMVLDTPVRLRAGRILIDRGIAHPVPGKSRSEPERVEIIVPVLVATEQLDALLTSLRSDNVLVVDDGSRNPAAIRAIAIAHGARIVQHEGNLGPAAARNTGIAHTTSPLIASIDVDCTADPDWINALVHHFDDPRIGLVAPRVRALVGQNDRLSEYERTRSSLDMGPGSELVQAGARLGYVPSAAFVARRAALPTPAFRESMRVGEDVDLIWNLTESGWLVRYDAFVSVGHSTRDRLRSWALRKYQYGTSAADLDRHHPGNLTPARPTVLNVLTLALACRGNFASAATVFGASTILLARALREVPQAPSLAIDIAARGLVADGQALGQLLRREWWPIGAVVLACSGSSRTARLASVLMIAPLGYDWLTERSRLDPVTYAALRIADDVAYGTGVIASCLRGNTSSPLTPKLSGTWLRGLAKRTGLIREGTRRRRAPITGT